MGSYLAFIGPGLKVLNSLLTNAGSLVNDLAAKSGNNPKTALLIAAAGWAGVRPEDLVSAGKVMANIGLFVVKVGQAMGG